MNLNPNLITKILNLTVEINLKQSQLNFLLQQVLVPTHPTNPFNNPLDTFDRYPYNGQANYQSNQRAYPPPPNPFNQPMGNICPNPSVGEPQQWYVPTSQYFPVGKHHIREPAIAEDFEIEPVLNMIYSSSFTKSFTMSAAGLEKAKNAGVLQLKLTDTPDKLAFIRIRGTRLQPTIQIVILNTDYEMEQSYTYSTIGRVKDAVENEWVLVQRLEDYKIDRLQVQRDFFNGYPQYSQPKPKD